MSDPIGTLIPWVSLLLGALAGLWIPVRAGRSGPPAPVRLDQPALWPDLAPPPPHRSPYSLGLFLAEAADPGASPLVRPYLTAHEQHERRHALMLATYGIDAPGPYWIHGVEVA
ncbi:hypothetical protein H9Y04_16230 [Streptomyces sp. TRM66268-LWL]|uniref:Uncharacterized protein n=1 Tax=Streptomyces polyasparticus TaxID=2767826 RepID=A0ABR7SF38_9ACTN|nr:hypothetical protein [Streptomyces polyasparticus]MBC9714110.1 hypothetical protein [Streptomyces polyasparticus]